MRSPSSRPTRIASGVGAGLLALSFLSGPFSTALADQGDRDESRERIAKILIEAEEEGAKEASSAARLAGLGASTLQELFEVLAANQLPVSAEEAPVALSSTQRAILIQGLSSFGRERLVPVLQKGVRETKGERQATLELMKEVGSHRELGLVVEAASPTAPSFSIDYDLASLVESATAAILARDDQGIPKAGRLALGVDPIVGGAVVRAIGSVPRLQGLLTLSGLLGFQEELDATLLTEIGALGQELPHPIPEAVCENVRAFLLEPNALVAREAALAVGKLEDCAAVDELIGLLEVEERSLRENALWSLRRISGLGFSDVARWQTWLRSEKRWLQEEAPPAFRALQGGELGAVVGALKSLSAKRYRRAEIAQAVAELLEDNDPEFRLLACAALGQLGSNAVIGELSACLTDPEASVGAAAWRALQSITRTDLTREQWSATLSPRGTP